MDDAAKAAKRAEIEAKVAAMKAEQKKQEEQKAAYFGEHQGITCDGCGAVPIIGYRFRCKNCPNHDICEACHERWDNGKGSMANGLAKQQISLDPKDHDFFIHKERGFKPLVKTAGPTQKSEKKLKPNDPCSCGSGKKAKKCGCGAFS
uniref:ZZ-type domain-containing protein n=1 Tax=Micromonas pusilla TaxID=38833 RepID=A0A6U0R8K9_MICPS|mmetsp:Transcript_3733/g.16369  ORF Transcript_3733/g.16369 Transcript_3733/m.16369 type:complete len:148 (-) Transcript_3733:130-573(-)